VTYCPCLVGRELIGAGGDCRVYRVNYMGEECALRIPSADARLLDDYFENNKGRTLPTQLDVYDRDLKAFEYEIKVWRELSDRARGSVVKLLDSGNTPIRWAVMELAERDFSERIRGGEASLYDFMSLLKDLEAIHKLGIVHLDIKPSNIRWASRKWRFSDFDNAEFEGDCRCGKSTLGFTAPEQLKGGATDRSTDIYQMGCLLYCIIRKDPKGVPVTGPEMSGIRPDIGKVLSKCLAEDPYCRYQSVKDLFADIMAIVYGKPPELAPDQGGNGTGSAKADWSVSPSRGSSVSASAGRTPFKRNPDAYWHYDEATKNLTIGGEGPMDDFGIFDDKPWLVGIVERATVLPGITSIGNGAFQRCASLQSITIPSSVKSIGKYAFYSCTSLQSITIPSSVTSIGEEAFAYCKSLQSITIPSGVTSIGYSAFSGCDSLRQISVDEGNSTYVSAGGCLYSNLTLTHLRDSIS